MISYAETCRRCLKTNIAEKPLYARTVTFFFSTRIVWLLSVTNVTPNTISYLSLFCGLASAYFILEPAVAPNLMWSAVLLEIYYILDCVDGQLSRLRQNQTKTGAFLDTIITYLVQSALYFALGIGLFYDTGKFYFVLLGAVAAFSTMWISLIWHFRASIFVYFIRRSGGVKLRPHSAVSADAKKNFPAGLAFSWLQKSLTFPLTMNLLTLVGITACLSQTFGGSVSALKLAESYLVYTSCASIIVAFTLTLRWISKRKIDSDYAELFEA